MKELGLVLSEIIKEQEEGIVHLEESSNPTVAPTVSKDAAPKEKIIFHKAFENVPLHVWDQEALEAVYADHLPPYSIAGEPLPPTPAADIMESCEFPLPKVQDAGLRSSPHTSNPSTSPSTPSSTSRESPATPTDFKSPFLFPMLTQTEKQRLTSLWYLTRDIEKFPDLLQHLNEASEQTNGILIRRLLLIWCFPPA